MKNNSKHDILGMGLIIAAVIGINVITASRPPQQFTMVFLVAQIVIFLCYLGWIGLGELRKVEKLGLVRSFQVIVVVLALPALFSSSVLAPDHVNFMRSNHVDGLRHWNVAQTLQLMIIPRFESGRLLTRQCDPALTGGRYNRSGNGQEQTLSSNAMPATITRVE